MDRLRLCFTTYPLPGGMAPSRTSQHGVTGAVEVKWMESYLLPLSFSVNFFASLLHLSPSHSFTCLTLLLFLPFHSVSVQPTEQQYGTRFGEQTSVYQSLQLRDHLQRANAVTLLPAKLDLRGHVSSSGHPLQHRLPWAAQLRGHLPAV